MAILCFLLLSIVVNSLGIQNDRVLVLLDKESYKATHSSFFKFLQDSGFAVDYKISDANDIALEKFKEYVYDHLVIFASATEEFGGFLNSKILTKFVDSGRNVMLALGNKNGQVIREFAADCGFIIDSDNARLNNGNTIKLTKENLINIDVLTKDVSSLWYSGGGVYYDAKNPLMIPIVSMKASDEESPFTYLSVAVQAKNSARVTVLGSSDIFSDSFLSEANDNKKFADNMIKWTFQKAGRLRIASMHHHLVNETDQPSSYTIRQHLYFEIKIEEYVNNKWQAFCVDGMQLEFIRIDPFVRQNLQCNDGVHSVEFQIPDVHGVYKFHIDYVKPGYSRISISSLIPVKPLRHDEYERFIPSALPYYITCLGMAIAPFILSVALLYHKDPAIKLKQN
ncbi:hypothetical protein GJ496_006879 [Pomphorhynchus laevis]|nr:hypothetical protein GJ496_006879 [Pomphorhynchus laevis]